MTSVDRSKTHSETLSLRLRKFIQPILEDFVTRRQGAQEYVAINFDVAHVVSDYVHFKTTLLLYLALPAKNASCPHAWTFLDRHLILALSQPPQDAFDA